MHRLAIALSGMLVWTGAVWTGTGLAQTAAPSPGIPYDTVAAALAALKAKPGVKFSTGDGWTFADDTDVAQWTFTPPNHYANPSVGRRELHQQGGRIFVVTRILCEAQK
ncbi:MAG: hypothetical protein AB7V13_25325, partial [Pseudorhodoplanes sp.]